MPNGHAGQPFATQTAKGRQRTTLRRKADEPYKRRTHLNPICELVVSMACDERAGGR